MHRHDRSDQKSFWGIKANATVSITSILIIFILILSTLIIGEPVEKIFKQTQNSVSDNVGWLFTLLINSTLLYALYLGVSKFGKIRIGGEDAKPDFSKKGWYSMLFSAGMGIGLLFFSVAEPILHFNDNPFNNASTTPAEAAEFAMGFTFLHWGLHGWGLYAIVGLALSFFAYNLKLPLTIRSIFYPIFGKRIYGVLGDIIDIIAVITTIFGLATSLGLGAQQINSGLNFLFDIPTSKTIELIIITVITFFAALSLVLGLDKGIRLLSEWNLRLAFVLLLAVLLLGPTIFLLKGFVQNIGHYLFDFFQLSFWSNSYEGIGKSNTWQNAWTIFYWSWWVSWSPFVGIFIARISKGRTIQEFIFGVLFVPSTLTFLWMSIFGGSALFHELQGDHSISTAVNDNVSTAIFYLLEKFPFSSITSFLTVILVTSFFVTSSDSGSFVVDMLTSGGRLDAPKSQKIFWASMEGLIAGILLIGGGLAALQTMIVLSGLPFAILIIIMCFSFNKALRHYYKEHYR